MSGPSVAVVGGGVTGLVAARALAASCEVTIFESAASLGGKLETATLENLPIDIGPDAFITRQSAAERLCRELGLTDDLLAPSSNSVAIFTKGELHQMPKGIVLGVPTDLHALRASNVVGTGAIWRATRDLLGVSAVTRTGAIPRAELGEDDPSVEEVFAPRLGHEIVRILIDPLLGGINASDVASLSLAACAPQLLTRLEGRRSVMRALRAEPATFTPGSSRPPFLGLRQGMAELANALESACRDASVEICCDSEVLAIGRFPDGRWKLTIAAEDHVVDAVLLACPAFAAAKLLEDEAPELSSELGEIPFASVVTACFSFPDEAVPAKLSERLREVIPGAPASDSPLVGSGVLIPRDGRHLVTGATFTSSKWPRSAARGQIVIRAFAGRHRDERAVGLGDAELQSALLADLQNILGITASPTASLVKRWEKGLPQYVTGHLARLRRIEALLANAPSLGLAGASYHGIGIPACIEDGERAASRLLASLAP
ncbi:MAG TPA: protoporphyrinogen oxidase [Acidimicrobiales bacterium]